jgi:Lrp/AsnC family transcriptional regulator for asnA, asnC and gidA
MEDARKPILQIANKIGIRSSNTPTLAQTRTIRVISGSKFIVNNKIFGLQYNGFCRRVSRQSLTKSKAVKDLMQVLECPTTETCADTNKNNM